VHCKCVACVETSSLLEARVASVNQHKVTKAETNRLIALKPAANLELLISKKGSETAVEDKCDLQKI